ncbi:hypothetical protein T069G_04005 [Trichoderma breve]|uniref:Uncharacterized protein n=1 Tax=Trichoderma breve TaxID=2034170 RepID=A0A9W9BN70_9HYPO|nr:hypothetical protein T069G_04005 [Trichoderma breve]KAJ4863051.1 hypothetical protein T069G_04005 [Trichoderma breve]
MVLQHLPLIGLALSLVHHHNHARSSHHHPSLSDHKPAAQISADTSPLQQAPKLIAARASDETQNTTIQVSQHHLQTILDKIKTLEEEIFDMMRSKADSSLDLGSTPAKNASMDSATVAPPKPEKLVVTTREQQETTPATAIFGGLFKEASVDLDTSAISDSMSTTIITSTTRITRTVTVVPTGIVTVTTFPSHLAIESNFKAIIPFVHATADANPPRTTLSVDTLSGARIRLFNLSLTSTADENSPRTTLSVDTLGGARVQPFNLSSASTATADADRPRTTLSVDNLAGDRVQPLNLASTSTSTSTSVDAEQGRPTITAMAFNASTSIHRLSLSAASSGFRTLRRAA